MLTKPFRAWLLTHCSLNTVQWTVAVPLRFCVYFTVFTKLYSGWNFLPHHEPECPWPLVKLLTVTQLSNLVWRALRRRVFGLFSLMKCNTSSVYTSFHSHTLTSKFLIRIRRSSHWLFWPFVNFALAHRLAGCWKEFRFINPSDSKVSKLWFIS